MNTINQTEFNHKGTKNTKMMYVDGLPEKIAAKPRFVKNVQHFLLVT